MTLAGQADAGSPTSQGALSGNREAETDSDGFPSDTCFPGDLLYFPVRQRESFVFILKPSLCDLNFEVCKDRTFSTGNFLSHWEGHRVPPNQVVEGKPPQLSWPSLMLSFLTSGRGGFKGE